MNLKHSVATGANELKIYSLIISHVLQSLYLCLEKKIFAVTNTLKIDLGAYTHTDVESDS